MKSTLILTFVLATLAIVPALYAQQSATDRARSAMIKLGDDSQGGNGLYTDPYFIIAEAANGVKFFVSVSEDAAELFMAVRVNFGTHGQPVNIERMRIEFGDDQYNIDVGESISHVVDQDDRVETVLMSMIPRERFMILFWLEAASPSITLMGDRTLNWTLDSEELLGARTVLESFHTFKPSGQ